MKPWNTGMTFLTFGCTNAGLSQKAYQKEETQRQIIIEKMRRDYNETRNNSRTLRFKSDHGKGTL
jgi:hypothetical protein